WLSHFITNPQKVISSGDKRAGASFKKYKSVMPSFAALKDEEITAIISFLNTYKLSPKEEGKDKGILNPIPGKIVLSAFIVNLREVTQFPASTGSGKAPLTRITKLGFQ